MTNELNFKELYEVSLKSTLPIEVSGTKIEAGETIASFDRIQIANFQEIKSAASANGGWEDRKSTRLNSSHVCLSRMPSSA